MGRAGTIGMIDRVGVTVITASFAEPADAEAAVTALVEADVSRSSIAVEHGLLPEARGREGRFVWRVLVIVVLWSIAGAIPGALFGLLLAVTIGPEGMAGLIVQVVCWTIVGHLIGGMLAGYFVLADRSQEEMPPDRPVSIVSVRVEASEGKRVRKLLLARRPVEVRVAGRAAS
jgi:hypothetical protein